MMYRSVQGRHRTTPSLRSRLEGLHRPLVGGNQSPRRGQAEPLGVRHLYEDL